MYCTLCTIGAHLDMIHDDFERHRRLVELNVVEQVREHSAQQEFI